MGVSNNDNESLFHIEQNQPKQKAVSVGVIPYDWIIDIKIWMETESTHQLSFIVDFAIKRHGDLEKI